MITKFLNKLLAEIEGPAAPAKPAYELGLERLGEGDALGAVVALEAAAAAVRDSDTGGGPRRGEVWVALGRARLAAKAPAQARLAFEQAVLYGNKAERGVLHYQLAEACRAAGDSAAAEAAYRKAGAIDPKHTDAFIRLGTLLFEAGRHAEAAVELDKAVYLDRKARVARYFLAQTLVALKDDQRALAQLHFLEQLNPDYAPLFQLRSQIHERRGDHRQVVTELRRLQLLGKADGLCQFRLGKSYVALQDDEQALKSFQQAVALEPTAWVAWLYIAQLEEKQHHLEASLAIYRKLIAAKACLQKAEAGAARIEAKLSQIRTAIAA